MPIGLSDYSIRFANLFFETFPEWKSLSAIADDNALIVRIPAKTQGLLPNAVLSVDNDYLIVDTEDTSVRVSFDYYHAHFDRFAGVVEREEFEAAIKLVSELLQEEICVASAFQEEQWQGSTIVQTEMEPTFPLLKKGLYTIYVRSWNGTYNKVFPYTQDNDDERVKFFARFKSSP